MTKKNELNIEEIKKLIPHRYPFLLIDKLIDIIPKQSAVGVKNVTFNENFFQGHFESRSVMPGALIIESMAQSAGTLVMYSLKKNQENISVYLLTVDKAKFRHPVRPGDRLKLHSQIIAQKQILWRFNCQAYVEDKLVCSLVLTSAVRSSVEEVR